MALTPADVAALDGNAAALGTPTSVLMDAAGGAVAAHIQSRYPQGTVVVFAGLGNNGGDGLVAARVLHAAGRHVKVLLTGPLEAVKTETAQGALRDALAGGVPVVPFSDVVLEDLADEADVMVDAMLGVGAAGPLRAPVDRVAAILNAHEVPIVAVDLPTGHGGPSPVYAALTVTFHDVKVGMDAHVCGEVVVADIGIPVDAERYVGPGDLVARYPRTDLSAHKGTMGRLLIVGGGPYTGAPTLSALGAFGTGTDLVHLGLPGRAMDVAAMHVVEAIGHPLEGAYLDAHHEAILAKVLDDVDVLCIGPGLGRAEETLACVRRLVARALADGKRCVVDADGLAAFGDDVDTLRSRGVVITPHAGEFRRLGGADVTGLVADARREAVQAWIGDKEVVVLLKGPEDLIASRDHVVWNRTHHPAMTTGGTGDVLAGVVAALLGRGMSTFDAARVGAYVTGAAGQRAFARRSWGLRAGDVAAAIPDVLRDHMSP